MSIKTLKYTPIYIAIALATTSAIPNAIAQESTEPQVKEMIEEISILGSRRMVRTNSGTAAPVDILTQEDISRQGSMDMNDMIRGLVPSFNVATQPNSDEAAFIRPANLRNLPPDHTLVLVNGKRRHRGAVISFLGSGVSDGAQGPDISPIPTLALKSVQVLRDGAAAQYGSDAIAGVINFQLKDDDEGFTFTARRGATFEGDGANYRFGANAGFGLGDDGFINVTAEWAEADRTERQVQRGDAEFLSMNNPSINNPAQTWGSPDVKDDLKLFVNAGFELSDTAELYSFANYADKKVETVFFYRTPDGSDRSQRFSNDGGTTVLVGDTNLNNDITCPTITIENGNPTTSPGFDQISAGGALDSECFALAEIYPGGFTPTFGADVTDSGAAVGIRGVYNNGFSYDLSAHWGQSKADYFFINSVNPSYSDSVANSVISPGFNVQTDTNVNLDLSYPIDVGFYSDLNIAGGLEWRNEEYEVGLGDPEGREAGDLAGQGFRETVDGFAGFSNRAAGKFSRSNAAAYLDLEADVIDGWVLGAALRFEDFEDFGSTTNYKVSSHYSVTDDFALRGTVSTGFRAPTPGQSNSIRTSTIVTSAGISESGTLSPTDPLAIALANAVPGAPQPEILQPEDSSSFTFGAVFDIADINIAVDFFLIDIEDRITLSSDIPVSATLAAGGDAAVQLQLAIDALAAVGDASANSISGFNFFVNDFDTRTTGVDIVASMPIELNTGDTMLTFAYNHTNTEVTSDSTFLSDKRVFSIENGLPEDRFTLTATHQQDDWNFVARGSYFGDIGVGNDLGRGALGDFDGNYSSKFLVDFEAQYFFNPNTSVAFGVQNMFNTYPDRVPQPQNNAGQIYPEESPFGFNGGMYYVQLNYSL